VIDQNDQLKRKKSFDQIKKKVLKREDLVWTKRESQSSSCLTEIGVRERKKRRRKEEEKKGEDTIDFDGLLFFDFHQKIVMTNFRALTKMFWASHNLRARAEKSQLTIRIPVFLRS